MRERTLPDPATFRDRSCRNVDPDVFFPTTPAQKRVVAAVCGSCPRLGECADWAIPQVLAGLLTESVVAGVQMPSIYGRSKTPREQLRRDAATELAEVVAAATGARMDEVA